MRHVDEESMSSGDESDDGDLTEGSSCGSDISQWNEGTHPPCCFVGRLTWYIRKMTPQQRNMLLPSVTLTCPDTMVSMQANLHLGWIAPSLPFGYGTASLIPGIIIDPDFFRIVVPTLILLSALRLHQRSMNMTSSGNGRPR